MEALFKSSRTFQKLMGRAAPAGASPLWLKKQVEWYGQAACVPSKTGNGKKWEKEIRRLLALDIKKKTPYQSGTKLIREYKGKRYEVLILNEGFIFERAIYKSLSKIAEKITGTRWNGNLFFNVRRT